MLGRFAEQGGAVVIGLIGLPLADHVFQIGDQQGGDRFQVCRATVAETVGAAFTLDKVASLTVARTGVAAVEVLAPEQEFDGVVAGGNVGF